MYLISNVGKLLIICPPHINLSTGNPCDGDSGVVKDLSEAGITAYVECYTCHDIVMVKP